MLIGGFVLQGNDPKKILIRAVGPSLSASNVPGVLQDPTVELFDSSATSLGRNNDWQTTQIGGVITTDQNSDIQATTLAPLNTAESAIIATPNPGSYTAILRGVNSTTGVALVQFYDVSDYSDWTS